MRKRPRPRFPSVQIGNVVFFYCIVLGICCRSIVAQELTIYSPLRALGRLQFVGQSRLTVSVIAAGDLLLGGSATSTVQSNGYDYPFDSTRSLIERSDFAMANLEAPFGTGGSPFDKKYTFRVPPNWAAGIANAGFDVLTLANNHILDYGEKALVSTMSVLDSLDLAYCGAGRNRDEAEKGIILKSGDWTIGFLAYSLTYPEEFWATDTRAGTAYPYQQRLEKSIRDIKSKVDFVIVSFHWGGELRQYPKGYQKQFAHQSIDWGADLIIGHHPHVLQGFEIYNQRLIAYSLGNYVFGSYSRNARDAALLKMWFDRTGSLLAQVIPISVDNHAVHFQPVLLTGNKFNDVINELNKLSLNLNKGESLISKTGLILFDK